MTKEPFVSVIISVFNGERFLRRTIDSIIGQSHKNMEIIIVDDASTDSSRKIICSYSDERIITVFQTENTNYCSAANRAFAMAKGKYCALIGHDDIWEPEKLEKQVAYMESHGECGICFTRCNIITQDDSIINENHFLYDRFNNVNNGNRYMHIRTLFLYGNFFCASSAVIRNSVLNAIGYYQHTLLQLQDYDLWLRILAKSEIYIIEEPLTNYRQILDSSSNLSAITGKSRNRTNHETNYICDKFLYELDNDCFQKAFSQDFENKSAHNDMELQCERMLLLKKNHNFNFVRHLILLLENSECRKMLSETYKLTLHDFYELNASLLYWEPSVYEYLQSLEKSVEKYKQLAQKQQDLLVKQEKEIKKKRLE